MNRQTPKIIMKLIDYKGEGQVDRTHLKEKNENTEVEDNDEVDLEVRDRQTGQTGRR